MSSVTEGVQGMRMPYRPGLDGVRAVAIVIVLLDHAGFGPFPNSATSG